jgi:hypothetical protein
MKATKADQPMALPTQETGDCPRDTVVVAAHQDGFNEVFLGADCWHAIRIAAKRLEEIRYIAVYQTAPVAAITHYAEVSRIEPYGAERKYRVVFSGKAKPIGPIAFARGPKSRVGLFYTTFDKLKSADSLEDLMN